MSKHLRWPTFEPLATIGTPWKAIEHRSVIGSVPKTPMARGPSRSQTVALTTGVGESVPNLQLAQERVQQLTADDTEFFRGVSTPDRDR